MIGSGTTFVGCVVALASITLATGARVSGRVLARTGAVTLDTTPSRGPSSRAHRRRHRDFPGTTPDPRLAP